MTTNTHRRNITRLTAKVYGYEQVGTSYSQKNMDFAVVLSYCWETTRKEHGKVHNFIALTQEVAPKVVDVDEAIWFARQKHDEFATTKSSVGIADLIDEYIIA